MKVQQEKNNGHGALLDKRFTSTPTEYRCTDPNFHLSPFHQALCDHTRYHFSYFSLSVNDLNNIVYLYVIAEPPSSHFPFAYDGAQFFPDKPFPRLTERLKQLVIDLPQLCNPFYQHYAFALVVTFILWVSVNTNGRESRCQF